MKDVAESLRVGKAVRAKHKRCYWNAIRAIKNLPEYQDADYVEGYAVLLSPVLFPLEHGWLEKDGKVIDPTMAEKDLQYFAGLRWRLILRQDNHPPRPVGKPLEHVVALLTARGPVQAGMGTGPTLPTPHSSRVPTVALNACVRHVHQDVPWTRPFTHIKPAG